MGVRTSLGSVEAVIERTYINLGRTPTCVAGSKLRETRHNGALFPMMKIEDPLHCFGFVLCVEERNGHVKSIF